MQKLSDSCGVALAPEQFVLHSVGPMREVQDLECDGKMQQTRVGWSKAIGLRFQWLGAAWVTDIAS
jgi:hypothetical protein